MSPATGAVPRGPGVGGQTWGIAFVWLLGCALPLLESPTPTDPVAPTRLVLLGAALACGLVAAPTGRLPRPVGVALVAGLVVFAAAALAGGTPLLSLIGRYPRYEGLPVVAGYAALVWLGARLVAQGPRVQLHLRGALATSTILGAVAGVVQVVAFPGERVIALAGNATTAGILGVIAMAVLGWSLSDGVRWWAVAGFAAGVLLVVLSASRGAQLAALTVAAASLVVTLRRRERTAWRWWVGALAGGALAVVLLPTARARLTGATPFAEATVEGRLLLWQETLELWRSSPWFGVGPSRFVDSIGRFHTEVWAASVGPYAPPDSPHNVALQVAAAAGALGVAAVLALAATVLASLLKGPGLTPWVWGGVAAACGAGVAWLFAFTDPITTPLACVLLGSAVGRGAGRAAGRTGGGVPGRLARVAAAAVLALGLVWTVGIWRSEDLLGRVVEHPQAAASLGQAAVGARPWDPDLARRLVFALDRLAEAGSVDPGLALAHSDGLCARLPGSVECLHAVADAHDLSGDHAGALALLADAEQLDPTNVDTQLKRGIALAESGHLAGAEAAFDRAKALRPTAPEVWANLAQLYRLQGREADAAAAEARAEALRPR